MVQYLVQTYGMEVQSSCVKHAILSCLYRLEVNRISFGRVPAMLHLNESYRQTREAIRSESVIDVLYAVIFMMFGAMLEDNYVEFYQHSLAFNSCLETLATSNLIHGQRILDALFCGAYAILHYRRPKALLETNPSIIWQLEDKFFESCQRLIIPFERHARVKCLLGWLRIHVYFWSARTVEEDKIANWDRPLRKIEFPAAEFAALARAEMKPGIKQIEGLINLLPSGDCLPMGN